MSTKSKEGKIYVSINPDPKIAPAKLPKELEDAPKSSDRTYKLGAIHELGLLLKGEDFRMSMAAEGVLSEFLNDDSKVISKAASDALERPPRPQQEPQSKKTRETKLPEIEVLPTPTAPAKSERSPSPIAAAILSSFSGGLGQLLLLGQRKKGLTLILLFLFSLFIPVFNLLTIPLIIIIGVGDAYGTAQKLRDGSTVKEWEFNINWKASAAVVIIILFMIFMLGVV
jgi:hypothetical protein